MGYGPPEWRDRENRDQGRRHRLTEIGLRARIAVLEAAIRKHRDYKGHDRCWANDQELYAVLGEQVPASPELPPKDEFLAQCAVWCPQYYDSQAQTKDAPQPGSNTT